jgi:hypothetical protein
MAKVICDTDVMIDYFDKSKPCHADTVKELEGNISLDNVLMFFCLPFCHGYTGTPYWS